MGLKTGKAGMKTTRGYKKNSPLDPRQNTIRNNSKEPGKIAVVGATGHRAGTSGKRGQNFGSKTNWLEERPGRRVEGEKGVVLRK